MSEETAELLVRTFAEIHGLGLTYESGDVRINCNAKGSVTHKGDSYSVTNLWNRTWVDAWKLLQTYQPG